MGYSLILSRDHDGRRIDRAIRSIWPELPLSAVMRALRKGEVRVDLKKVHEPGARIYTGQELYVPWPLKSSPLFETGKVETEKIETGKVEIGKKFFGKIPVLWRGDCAMAINKPSGLLVQPDEKHGDSVITRVWAMLNNENNKNNEDNENEINNNNFFRPAAVHRLDRNTTGVLIVALHGDSLRALELLFKERKVKKFYRAVVTGRAPDFIEINAPLLKNADLNIVKVVKISQSPEAKTAITRCKRLEYDAKNDLSLVDIELLTGRTHQARVHMAHIGHAILGDRKYGDFSANKKLNKNLNKVKRPLLHAFKIIFPDKLDKSLNELSGKTFQAEMPLDMQKFFDIK